MRRKLLFAIAALLCSVGSWAYTTSDLTSAGWTQVTDLSSLTLSDNYFVLVDAGASATAMTLGNPATGVRPSYTTLADPFAVSQEIWIIESGYKLKSMVSGKYFNSGSYGWDDSMSDTGTDLTFTINDGKYKISCGKGHAGPWNDKGAVGLSDGYEDVALNKAEAKAPGFYIYYISRTAYNAARRNGAKLASEGWSQVTTVGGLNLSGYYYALLDVSEAGYESGFAMTGATGGRPQSQALTDPVTNQAQSWIIKSHDDGKYVLQCAQDNKYFRCDGAGWNTGFIDNIDADGTDFTFAVSDGKWTLSNEKDAGNFVGRWGNSVLHPFQGESIAANKAAEAGKKQYLIYSIPTIAAVATALPGDGNMVADTWYYIDIAVAGDNYNATATNLGNIVYSGDAGTTVVPRLSTSSFTETDNTLAAHRYYVKSSTTNHLEITAASYSYEVGSATSNITWIQQDNTVTVTYSDLGTNDPGAVLTKDFSGVTFGGNAIAVTPTSNGFTFTVPDVSANTAYTLAIPANAIGYAAGSTYNAAQNIILNTPVLFDGEYYFQKKNTDTYIGRGGDWGTRAVVADLGFSFDVSVLPNGKYYLKNHDWSLAANANKYLGYTSDIFVDRSEDSYTIEAADGGVILRTHDNKYVKATTNSDNDVPYDYLDVTETVGDAIIWVPISKETYLANLATLRNTEAAAVATSAGKSASTVAELASLIASDFWSTDMTSSISNAGCRANLDDWTQVKYAVGNKNFDANGTSGEVWAGFGGIKQEIAGLAEGIYKVSVHATWRPGDAASGNRAGNDINTNAWVYANTATSSNLTQLKSWYAGGHTIDSRSDMVASGTTYLNDVYVYVSEGETLTIGLASPSTCNGAWLPFFDWSLTYYEAKPTTAEKAALASAIATAETHTLGFESGEYAPYNNLAALEALAAAKAITPETATGAAVVAATTALTGASWTANDGEVNAIYDGTFSNAPVADATGGVNGWSAATGLRQLVESDVVGSIVTTGMYVWGSNTVTYGETTGYTLPLKAGTVYKLTYDRASWGGGSSSHTGVTITDPNGTELGTATEDGWAGDWNSTDGTLLSRAIYFVTTTAGNYKLALGPWGNSVYANMALYTTNDVLTFADGSLPSYVPGTYPNVALTRTFASADNWYTLCVPFEFNKSEFAAVKELDAITVNGENVSMSLTDASTIVAGKPYLVKPKTDNYDALSATDVAVVTSVEESSATSDGYTVNYVGTYAGTTVNAETAGGNAFVVKNNGIYHVNSAVSVGAYRAYFTVEAETSVKALIFDFDELPTAINAVEAAQSEKAEIYNLAGQRLNKAQKGVNIINGKKVLVK